MAAGINSVYTDKLEQEVEEDLEEDVETQLQEIDIVLFERLHGSGLLFSKVTTKSWVLVFSNTPHFEIDVEVHSENKISIVLSGEKPSAESLRATQDVTGIRPDEWGFEEAGQLKCVLTLPAPAPLVTDKSKIQVIGFPLENPLHYYFTIPFYEKGSDAFHLKKFVVSEPSSSSSSLSDQGKHDVE
jgi:hypothetical protein